MRGCPDLTDWFGVLVPTPSTIQGLESVYGMFQVGRFRGQSTPILKTTMTEHLILELCRVIRNFDEPVAAETGVIVQYEVVGSAGAADQGADFYTAQIDISTTDVDPPFDGVFIPQGCGWSSVATTWGPPDSASP